MFKEQDPVCFCGTNTDQDVTQEFANAQVKLQNPLEPHYGLTHQSHYGLTRQSKGRYFPPTLNQHSSSMLVLMDYRVILNMCFKIDVHVCPCVCACVRVCACACPMEVRRGLERLELKLQVVVSCLMWVLDTELGSSARAASVLNA